MHKAYSALSKKERILFLLFFAFSSLLMWKTLSLDKGGNILIASKAWSDFAATIPLIRSFSFGSNFPPEYPIFAGPPIRYHYGFFALTGFLEKAGLPLPVAFNILSTVSFFLLLSAIYLAGKLIFKSKQVGAISIILFLLNGSFGFLKFFRLNPPSLDSLREIVQNSQFSSFGPYDGSIVSAFWSLNIYTNQRHLALAYGLCLLLIIHLYRLYQKPSKAITKKAVVLGFSIGLMPIVHLTGFIMMGISLLMLFLLFKGIRKYIFTVGAIALTLSIPQYLYMGSAQVLTDLLKPGYLVSPLTLVNFLKYWFLNFGLTAVIAPFGFLIANKKQRKILVPFLIFFVVGNLFQFTPDMPTNHKFFNMTVIGLNFFTSLFLIKLLNQGVKGKIIFSVFLIPLTLTGFIDFFPVFNDRYITLVDIKNNKTTTFIKESTLKSSVFLNATFLYDPASVAGRKIYLGWPYFSWSAGYDTHKRHQNMKELLAETNKVLSCQNFKKENINYVEIQNPTTLEEVDINYDFFEDNFIKVFSDNTQNISIYDVSLSCNK